MFFKFLLNTAYLPKYYDNKVFIKGKYVSLCDYLRFKKLQFYQFNFISKKRKTCKGMKSVHVQQIWFYNKFCKRLLDEEDPKRKLKWQTLP
jgi:hypothetical protein